MSGAVLDGSGAVISGVVLRLSVKHGACVTESVSNDDGSYRFASIPPGPYELEAGKADFKELTIRELHVQFTRHRRRGYAGFRCS